MYRDRVYEKFLERGFVATWRDGVDEPRPTNDLLYVIDLDDYFSSYERAELKTQAR